jgi:protein arginine kinase activator
MKKCVFCGKQAVFQVTEINTGKVESFDMCVVCGKQYLSGIEEKPKGKMIDVSTVETPEQLLELINEISEKPVGTKEPCPGCGFTSVEFGKSGKFGCPQCYDHFQQEFNTLVVPYQKADEHMGKRPRRKEPLDETPEEAMKTLLLRMKKASELENYELAAKFKKQIDELKKSIPSPQNTSEGQ